MEPSPAPEPRPAAPWRILAAAAIVHVILFSYQFRGTFTDLVQPSPVTPPDRTGPFVTGADAIGYYAWLRSPLIDGDFDFDNEFAQSYSRLPPGAEPGRTATGLRPNPWPIGPAIIWSPAVVIVHFALTTLGDHSPWPADGYSPPYQLAVGGMTLALALLTLMLVNRIARRFAGPSAAAAAAALVTLGTPVVCYGSVDVSMAHGPATAALVLFVFVWLRTFGSKRLGRWILLGGLLGMAALMRWQLITFAALPAMEAAWLAARVDGWLGRFRIAIGLNAAGLTTSVVFIPQLLAKQIVYGGPFVGYHQTAHNWLSPSLWAVLGSADRSLFYWTPLTLPAVIGLIALTVQTREPAARMLAIAVAIQVYIVSVMLGGEVALGWSFGFRILTETCAVLAPGLAFLLDNVPPRTVRRLAIVGGGLVGWNMILVGVHRNCLGDINGGSPAAVAGMAIRLLVSRPIEVVAAVIGAVRLTYLLRSAFRTRRMEETKMPGQLAA
jgi:hypothetical protein